MNRADAIAWLRAVGWNAGARDWVLGETIVIPIGRPIPSAAGVDVYRTTVYLVPEDDVRWSLLDLSRPTGAHVVATYEDLTAAVREADAYARKLSPDPDDDDDE